MDKIEEDICELKTDMTYVKKRVKTIGEDVSLTHEILAVMHPEAFRRAKENQQRRDQQQDQ